VQGLPNVKI